MRTFDKPAIDIGEQIALLNARGLQIQDEARARHFLEAVSFFRLTPYMRPFQVVDDPQHGFRTGAGFRSLTRLYDFDRRLRLLTMDAVERVEVAARAVISNHMGPSRGVHWYLNARVFKHKYDHQRLLNTVREKQERALRDYERECENIDRLSNDERKSHLKRQRAHESYARHYPLTYREPELMPGWAMVEELTLGDLSHLYAGLAHDSDRKAIARRLNLVAPLMESWLHTLTTIRNICAHHARLWNRELGIRPKLPEKPGFAWPEHLKTGTHKRMYPVLSILNHMMRQTSPHTSWDKRLHELLAEFPEVDLRAMGFPPHWQDDPFWQAPH
ncbi:Abi family protein [Pseudomonas lopnurensis]|uniref:Abi family protein n=1 Tax=Pseudomonas lopnurensis TaxID=1477517 RepID=UPI00187A60B9|nr:Abi family protein [Pseudomonas lopnurensis]MBE7376387.1 Abi family protein [Pseudomonas lopnurensis]